MDENRCFFVEGMNYTLLCDTTQELERVDVIKFIGFSRGHYEFEAVTLVGNPATRSVGIWKGKKIYFAYVSHLLLKREDGQRMKPPSYVKLFS